MPLWDACEEFLVSTTNKPRKISELIKLLSARPYKLKQGFLEFWIPTYLYIKKQEYSLYGTGGAYIPNVNMEFFELLQNILPTIVLKLWTYQAYVWIYSTNIANSLT